MKRQTLIRSALAAAVVLAATGCSTMGGGGSDAPPKIIETYAATLTPAEEVPPAAESKGSGSFEMKIDAISYEYTWKMSHGGMTGPATMAHIHGPAAKGANAGVLVPLNGMEGKGKLTGEQYGNLAASLLYVNVHSAKYPGGEIRGQLTKK